MGGLLYWLKNALGNQTIDPDAQFQEGQPAASLNEGARGIMAGLARWRDDHLGTLMAVQTLGTNDYTLTTNEGLPAIVGDAAALPAFAFSFVTRFDAAPTGAVMLARDGKLKKPVRFLTGVDISAGQIVTGAKYRLTYDPTAGEYLAQPQDQKGAAALASSGAPAYQGRLNFISSLLLRLDPLAGGQFYAGGANRTLPGAGLALSNAGLLPSTLYQIYLNDTATALEADTTAAAFDAATGTWRKSGDATRTQVGMAYTDGSGAFQAGLVRSRFNDTPPVATTGPLGIGTAAGVYTLLAGTLMRVLCWENETIDAVFGGNGTNSATNAGYYARARAVIGNAAGTVGAAYGPETRAGGGAFIAGGLASPVTYKPGAAGLYGVWAEGHGDYVSSTIVLTGVARTRT